MGPTSDNNLGGVHDGRLLRNLCGLLDGALALAEEVPAARVVAARERPLLHVTEQGVDGKTQGVARRILLPDLQVGGDDDGGSRGREEGRDALVSVRRTQVPPSFTLRPWQATCRAQVEGRHPVEIAGAEEPPPAGAVVFLIAPCMPGDSTSEEGLNNASVQAAMSATGATAFPAVQPPRQDTSETSLPPRLPGSCGRTGGPMRS
eukprot:CAMPEP_0175413318 /NCGR_PEP_ID=MMETSP0095-20121207/43091_1 /TAXON_ID=311494 /ORGANISM="Alexandrium monilatum, Strain CCMP3105" /LENGTH=204 /DNA_ID=CAMNT_0016712353 /DNA_START=29 /DNA_END=641 /DNA_ORIENTATION=+